MSEVGTELAGGTDRRSGARLVVRIDIQRRFNRHDFREPRCSSCLGSPGQKKLHLKKAGNLSEQGEAPTGGQADADLHSVRFARSSGDAVRNRGGDRCGYDVLNVSVGSVRVTRFSDGSTVDVPARHRLDRGGRSRHAAESPFPIRSAIGRVNYRLGPVRTQGKVDAWDGYPRGETRSGPVYHPKGNDNLHDGP